MKAKERKTKGNPKSRTVQAMQAPEQMQIVNRHAGGIDCGAREHYVAVPPDSVKQGESSVRCFSAFTEGLDAWVEWLKVCGVTTVAMESTGVYWIALCQKLETAGLEVLLVNARHVRHVPGRKTDVKDCQWIQRLHSFGLLNASFRPEDMICRLRSFQRHRLNMISSSAAEVQHMQKALQQMNLNLHHVVSDISGVSGLRIIDAILAGQRDPRAEASQPELQTAQIQAPGPAKQKRKRQPRANEPKMDLAGCSERICGVDLTQVIGLNVLSVLLIVSEIGVDTSLGYQLLPTPLVPA